MPALSLDDRLIDFEACFNFRDLGGYQTADGHTVKWGRIYRSDTLHRLTRTDLLTFERLGLTAVIDLRSSREIDDFGRLEESLEGPEWHHHPIIDEVDLRPGSRVLPPGEEDSTMSPGEGYFRFLGSGDVAVSVLQLIAESQGPVAFHCTSGKDRAGMISAMTLDLLGVPDETIAADYLLTQQTRERSNAWIEQNEPALAAFLAEIPFERRQMQPDAIMSFLGQIRSEHGSVAEFVTSRGLTEQQLDDLRHKLLESAG